MINCLFISKGHRRDTKLTLVLEDSSDFSRAVCLQGDSMGSLFDQTESGMLRVIAESLEAASGLSKEASVRLTNGIEVQAISFEHLVKVRLESHPVYLLDKKGEDIRSAALADDAVFLLTDHIPMPRKTFKSLRRQGVCNLSLGPVMLHASQCVVVIQNEYDRQF
jgi:tRNA (pseudouridine54-N1)-methyltransferase